MIMDQNYRNRLLKEFDSYKKMELKIDMTRGKPSKEQLDLSMPMMDILNSSSNYVGDEGIDCRNYGCLTGLSECKELLASIMEVSPENVIIFGNSSLNVMYECISDAFLYGVCGSTPWSKLKKIKWLCPVPGYDRHFAICEHFGIEMINIPMDENGPDMDLVEELIKDEAVKGIWCVPKYSNPTGITYSEAVVQRFAKLKPVASDFRIYWDDAYSVHHLYKEKDYLPELLSLAKTNHNEDIVLKFTSTSKISFPGSGVAAIAASKRNLKDITNHLRYKTIGYDKVNQLRHVKFFRDLNGIEKQMKKHADILRSKFELIEEKFKNELSGIATWTKPKGGYFVSLFVPGHAKEIIDRCKECGVILTDAGCSYPYHFDPTNSHIRVSPTFLPEKELSIAIDVICLCTKLEIASL